MFPRTLFLVAAIIDKYLSIKPVRKEDLQLVGAAALFLAAKYEETYQVPEAAELVAISAKVFTKSDILRMEAEIVRTLDFNLVFNTAYNFLEPFCCLLEYEPKRFFLAQYILELALLDARFLRYRPSLQAAATIYLINKIKRSEAVWPDIIVAASGYD
jgi:cyclin B